MKAKRKPRKTTSSPTLVIQPLNVDLLIMLCFACGHSISDLDDMRKEILPQIHLLLRSTNIIIGQDEPGNQECCDGCGAMLNSTYIRYSVDYATGIMRWNPIFEIGDLTINEAATISTYCHKFGSLIDVNNLQVLLLDWISTYQPGVYL